MRKPARGFTLIELMITVAIIGILAAVALPAYREHVIKSNRRAAQAQMMELANRQQQFLLVNRQYATTLAQLNNYALPSEVGNNYTCGTGCIATNTTTSPATTVPAFTLTFTATGSQASDGNLSLSSEGVKSPAAKW